MTIEAPRCDWCGTQMLYSDQNGSFTCPNCQAVKLSSDIIARLTVPASGYHRTVAMDSTIFSEPPDEHNTYPCFWSDGNLIFDVREPSSFGYADIGMTPKEEPQAGKPEEPIWTGRFQIVALKLNRIHSTCAVGEVTLVSSNLRFTTEITVRRRKP